MTDWHDAELVEQARAGEQEAFAILVRRHRQRVGRVVAAMLPVPADTEDILQEAFWQAYLVLDRLREPASFRAWVCGIALNLARMQLRTSARTLFAWETLEQLGVTLVDRQPSPERLAEKRETSQRLWEAIADLPPAEREALQLVYRDGLSQQETADQLGASLSAVKVRVHRGRQRVRAALSPEFAPVVSKENKMIAVEVWDVQARWPELEETDRLLAPLLERLPAGKQQELKEAVTFNLAARQGIHGLWELSQSLTTEMEQAEQEAFMGEWQKLTPVHVILLKETAGERVLPIWVGPIEADLIVNRLAGKSFIRPMMHDLTSTLLDMAGVKVEQVTVSRLENTIFYSTLTVKVGNGQESLAVDCRPSDALYLAVRMGVPIFVAPEVMESEGVRPDSGGNYSVGDEATDRPAHSLLGRS